MGDNDVVDISYGYSKSRIECDDFGDVAQEANILVNAVFGQRMKLPQARIAQNLCHFVQNLSGDDQDMVRLEQREKELAGQSGRRIVGAHKDGGVENNPHSWVR